MKRLNRDIIFKSDELSRNLAQKSVRGGMTTMTAQVIQFILRTAGTVVLARLLTPNDYGLIAMVAVVVGFAQMFKDAGLSMATVQKDRISHEQISTLFWINILISAFLGLCVLAASPLVARFYGRPELAAVTAALSVSFIISGLSIQHAALLRRHMQFGTLAIVQIGAQVITLTVTIILALYGWRYWALVGGSLTTAFFTVILTFFFCPWMPGRMQRGTGIRDMLKFGGHLTGFNFVNYFSRNLDNILLGRFCGANVLGLYSRAYNIMMLPISQIRGPLNAVAIPALSHLQNDPIRFNRYYLKLITLIAFIAMPLMAFLFVCADQVIYLLLGSQWLGAAAIFKILCIAAFIQPVATTPGLVLISLGQSKRYFLVGTVNSIITVISFVLGLPWGAMGVAVAYTISNYVTLGPTLWYCFRRSPISIMEFFSVIFRPIIASITMGFAVFFARTYLSNLSDAISLGLSLIISLLAYILVLFFMPGGVRFLREFSSYRSFLFQKNT
ncbi:MAG: lipopolysaccharide biosynthesis protein [Proteobacteria bacterium]|nr:lipopolysaccharide biosynthesis protein [Pseudomonadota bacterium]